MFTQILAFAVGAWLTAAPGLLGYGDPARSNDHVFGPLAATVGLTAAFGATRPLRWLNLPIGLWLVAAPWVLGYGRVELVNSILVGVALAASARVRGQVPRLGGGWRSLWDPAAASVPGEMTA